MEKLGMMQNKKKIAFFAMGLIIIDQIIKLIVSNSLKLYDSIVLIPNFLYLTFVKNDGAAWSILSGKRIFLVIISILATIFVIWLVNKEKNITKYKIIYYSMLIGGIIGNLIDRLFLGYVVDYIETNIFGYNFPIFNLADALISISVIMILIEEIIVNKRQK